jgi:hypothetical protein
VAIADVGNDEYEEVDLVNQGGRNFGWPLYEGPFRFNYPLCIYSDTLTLSPPAFWYPHAAGPSAIMMGGIVRFDPDALANFPPEYLGNVFYAELYAGKLYRLVCAGGTCAPAPPAPGQPDTTAWATELANPTRLRFGPDAGLWYVNGWGDLRRIRADLALRGRPARRDGRAPAARVPGAVGGGRADELPPAGGRCGDRVRQRCARTPRAHARARRGASGRRARGRVGRQGRGRDTRRAGRVFRDPPLGRGKARTGASSSWGRGERSVPSAAAPRLLAPWAEGASAIRRFRHVSCRRSGRTGSTSPSTSTSSRTAGSSSSSA